MKDIAIPLRLVSILSDGKFYSGQRLGNQMGMSRTAINKHIQNIREWGLDIFTVPGRGYKLSAPIQLLDPEQILATMPEGKIEVLSVIDSTNQYLQDKIQQLSSGDACVAEYQQSGRGRRGRKWCSPFGVNLYFSMYWKLKQGPTAATGLSLVIGLVMAEVLQGLGAEHVKVKWPNDLYLKDRKLAGILVESTGKAGGVTDLIIGAGINLGMRGSATEVINQDWINLQDTGVNIDRNQLTATLLTALRAALRKFELEGLTPFIARWRNLDNFLDRPVKLLVGKEQIVGIERGIDEQGALLLEQDGVIKAFIDGKISLRSA